MMQIAQHSLQFGPHRVAGGEGAREAIPYFLAGRKLYYVGLVGGGIQPIGAEHLAGEMGGIWAHPVKVADGLTLQVAEPGEEPPAPSAVTLTEALSHVEWRYSQADLAVRRRDFVAEEHAAFVSLLALRNDGTRPRAGELRLSIWLKFLGCWFGGLSVGGGEYWLDGSAVLGYDRLWQGRWGVAFGAGIAPTHCEFAPHGQGRVATLVYPFALAPGEQAAWEFLLVADHERGHEGARHLLGQLAGTGEALLADKIARYEHTAFTGVALATPDPAVDRAFALAKANLQLLSADYAPNLPPYFLAGIPEYPQLFGCDTEYTVPGAAAAGFADLCKSALLALANYGARGCGRIPHEITTNGRVFHPGNTQETPQFALACWDYFRWTGDEALLRLAYPLCKEGVDEYLPALWGPSGGFYPIGDGVVERQGMGSRKLDSTCYLFGALRALRDMAAVLGLQADAERYAGRMAELGQRFEQDWWLEAEGMYADSLHTDLQPQLDGHWTVVLPLQLGLADEARARRALERIAREWVNEWGLVHTREREQLVWTLPTGLLALAAFRYERSELGLRLLLNIAETTLHGTLGAFKELIPIGLCFVQLWSAGLYVQGVVEGLLGLQPLAHRHELAVAPCLPHGWPSARLAELRMGAHTLTLEVAPQGLQLEHHDGAEALRVRYRAPAPLAALGGPAASAASLSDARWITIEVPPGQALEVACTADRADIRLGALPHSERR
ncbi:MGH1-like glycoside hydrolase domain-containing protein [Kouleothrix sp.]|uniref:amylo-alpha-1,6-glucosidase n=1 Tax=Kouleothrix sp. TaxID=2779161 RepID=UPI00391DA413